MPWRAEDLRCQADCPRQVKPPTWWAGRSRDAALVGGGETGFASSRHERRTEYAVDDRQDGAWHGWKTATKLRSACVRKWEFGLEGAPQALEGAPHQDRHWRQGAGGKALKACTGRRDGGVLRRLQAPTGAEQPHQSASSNACPGPHPTVILPPQDKQDTNTRYEVAGAGQVFTDRSFNPSRDSHHATSTQAPERRRVHAYICERNTTYRHRTARFLRSSRRR